MALSVYARRTLAHALTSYSIADEIADVIDAGSGTLSQAAKDRLSFLLGDRDAAKALAISIDAGTTITDANENRLGFLLCDRLPASEIAKSLGTVSITTQPDDVSEAVGQTATFTVVAKNPVSYQWQLKDGETWGNITAATAASYETAVLEIGDNAGEYRVIVTGKYGSVTSDVATLTVT